MGTCWVTPSSRAAPPPTWCRWSRLRVSRPLLVVGSWLLVWLPVCVTLPLPPLHAALSDSVKACGAAVLALLADMKQRDSLAAADDGSLRVALEAIMATAVVSAGTPTHAETETNA